MQRTKIEWVRNPDGSQGYSRNPIKGKCKNNCSYKGKIYCFAIRMYDRFGWNPKVRFEDGELDSIRKLKNPSTIFLCSTHELFGDWIKDDIIGFILDFIEVYPQHTFILLSKNPERFDEFDFPKNVRLGITIDTQKRANGLKYLLRTEAKVKFISFEPLLEEININLNGIDWIILGGLSPKPVHNKDWATKLIGQAGALEIPVFLKDNLKYKQNLQEFPNH